MEKAVLPTTQLLLSRTVSCRKSTTERPVWVELLECGATRHPSNPDKTFITRSGHQADAAVGHKRWAKSRASACTAPYNSASQLTQLKRLRYLFRLPRSRLDGSKMQPPILGYCISIPPFPGTPHACRPGVTIGATLRQIAVR